MIRALLLGVGLVAIVEGLVLAIAPGRVEQALAALAQLTPEHRRLFGLLAITAGILLVSVTRA
ncbi:MAG: DUF2065 domain-containing protein [Amaricoccus sp.]|uniref:DUF2065 domain-containing protein n=1 Tax=Amaricoccus sp. TaxID=1872485 RepID=UPI0039E52703